MPSGPVLPTLRSPAEVDALVELHAPLARRWASRVCRPRPWLYYEDVLSEMLLALWRAAQVWDPVRGKFSTYACWWMRSHTTRHLRRRWRDRRLRTISLDATITHAGDEPRTLAEITPDPRAHEPSEPLQADEVLDALRCLPSRDRDVIEALAAGEACESVAARLGVSHQRVRQLRDRARQRLARERPEWAGLIDQA